MPLYLVVDQILCPVYVCPYPLNVVQGTTGMTYGLFVQFDSIQLTC